MHYPFLPLRDYVLFPYQKAVLFFGRIKSINSIEKAIDETSSIVLSAQKDPKNNSPEINDIYKTGVIARISNITRLTDGTYKAVIIGEHIFNIKNLIVDDYYFVNGEIIKEEYNWKDKITEVEALIRDIVAQFQIYTRIAGKKLNMDGVMDIISTGDPFHLCYGIAGKLHLKVSDKQKILENRNIVKKLELIYSFLVSEIEIIEVNKRIQDQVKRKISKTQKEIYLQEQLNAIQNELGYKADPKADLMELEKKLKELNVPEYVREKIDAELKKLKATPPFSAETSIIRNYLEWISDLPWGIYTRDESNLEKVENILNEDHYGLEKVKDRIVEYIAVKILSKSNKSPILCFVGPPGVGKTSLGKSIARALNRNFVRISLGGVKDEAEIRGHRRTYIGSLPGKIIQAMKRAKSMNPVFLLDEIDKISSDYRGDPASALLEVLDPEQNSTFNDHYLGMDFDLSNVMFIATANSLDGIPLPLRDRMEIIKIEGYTEFEKYEIADRYLIPSLLEETGLKENVEINFSSNAIFKIIENYTREAGVRNLKREIEKIFRKIAKKVVKEKLYNQRLLITKNDIEKYLGVPRYKHLTNNSENKVGVTNGLAWTPVGGEILTIEVSIMKGNGALILTGKLGKVMQESAHAALSYVRTRADVLGLTEDFYKLIDFHIHVPEGAIPKDGPSAGITIATSIISSLINVPVKSDIAMTGEITLKGEVLEIGGLKEKLLAAKRTGIKNVIIPEKNKLSLKEISHNILEGINIIPVKIMDEVILNALDFSDEIKENLAIELSEFVINRRLSKIILKNFHQYSPIKH